jgi:hypothetical protein
MALDLSGKDPSELTRDELLYLQDRDRLPEGFEPVAQEDREGSKTVLVAVDTGSALVPEDQLEKYTNPLGTSGEEGDEEVVEVDSYDQMTVEDLKAELAERGLDTKGKKDELIARLEADDAKNQG